MRIVESDAEMHHLSASPQVFTLRSPAYEHQLRQRLSRSCDIYLGTVTLIAETLCSICRKLGVSELGEVCSSGDRGLL